MSLDLHLILVQAIAGLQGAQSGSQDLEQGYVQGIFGRDNATRKSKAHRDHYLMPGLGRPTGFEWARVAFSSSMRASLSASLCLKTTSALAETLQVQNAFVAVRSGLFLLLSCAAQMPSIMEFSLLKQGIVCFGLRIMTLPAGRQGIELQ